MENYFFDTADSKSKGTKYYVLVIYDIGDNKRRTQLAKMLKSFGQRVQKSAFEARLTQNKYAKLLSKLDAFVRDDDSIRVYKLRGEGVVTVFGKDYSAYDEDVIII